jgi:hypothetical protein
MNLNVSVGMLRMASAYIALSNVALADRKQQNNWMEGGSGCQEK